MKKTVLCLIILLSASMVLSAAGKRIAIFNPTSEGLTEDEKNWIPSSVRRRLEANFNDYTTYQLVDIQNEEQIKGIQQKAESYTHDQETSIEIGKLVSAEIGVFSTITKANGKYILSVNLTNLTTGVRLSSVTTDSVAEPVSLFEGAGSSVNKVTVKLCDDLGIKLSSIDRYVLLKGEELSDNEQITITEEEVSKYEKKQKELERQLKEVSLSTELDAESRKAKLEAEKALADQQKQIAEERLERLRLQKQRLLEDQEQQKVRTAAQREKIEQAAAQAEKQAKLVRQQKIDALSVDNQIAVIEAKKQAMYDIHSSVLNQEKLIKQAANDDYKAQCEAIDAEPLRNGETDAKGNMLPAVKKMRNERKQQIRSEIESKALEDLRKIQGKTTAQEDSLYKDIQNDLAKLSTRRTISSIEDDRILDIGNYAGDKYEWDTTVSLFINDVKIFGQNANISYRNVSGKNPVSPTAGNTSAWNDYLDTVDLYDYMFRRNVPAVTLEIDYSIEAMPDMYPSMYKMTLYEFRFIDTVSGKVVQVIQPAKSSYRFSVNPAVDISYYKQSAAYTEAASTDTKKTTKKDDKKDEKKTENFVEYDEVKTGKDVKLRKSVNKLYDQRNGGGARCNIGFNIGYMLAPEFLDDEKAGFQLESYISFPFTTWMFSQIDYSWFTVPTNGAQDFNGEMSLMTIGLGFNVRPRSAGAPPNFYAMANIGAAFQETRSRRRDKDYDSLFAYKFAGGIDVPLQDFLCMTLEGGVIGLEEIGVVPYAKVGIAFTIPNLVF
ncbi:MAG: hypothetical protein IKX70_03330 [Treponema sp.]|nr:hypothetical protein [Treponema sp.]